MRAKGVFFVAKIASQNASEIHFNQLVAALNTCPARARCTLCFFFLLFFFEGKCVHLQIKFSSLFSFSCNCTSPAVEYQMLPSSILCYYFVFSWFSRPSAASVNDRLLLPNQAVVFTQCTVKMDAFVFCKTKKMKMFMFICFKIGLWFRLGLCSNLIGFKIHKSSKKYHDTLFA